MSATNCYTRFYLYFSYTSFLTFYLGIAFAIKNADLIDVWISSEKSKKSTNILKKIKIVLNIKECSDAVHKKLENVCKAYCLAIGQKNGKTTRETEIIFFDDIMCGSIKILYPKTS